MRATLSLIALVVASAAGRADDWQPLFNGKDLTGWKANNDPDSFAVKDGVLRVQASGKTAAHLFYVGSLSTTAQSRLLFYAKSRWVTRQALSVVIIRVRSGSWTSNS